MTAPESMLREAFGSVAGGAPATGDLAARARAGAARRSRRDRAVVASAALVVVAGVAFGALVAARPDVADEVSPGPSSSASAWAPPRAPAGLTYVSSGGLEVLVPEAWPVGVSPCPGRNEYAVHLGTQRPTSCPALVPGQGSPPKTVVFLGPAPGTVSDADCRPQDGCVRSEPVIDAVPATRSTTRDAEPGVLTVATALVHPTAPAGHEVVLWVSGTDQAAVEQVVASLRLVDVDAAGCPTVPPSTPPDRSPSDAPLLTLPAGMTATSVSRCWYRDQRTAGSTTPPAWLMDLSRLTTADGDLAGVLGELTGSGDVTGCQGVRYSSSVAMLAVVRSDDGEEVAAWVRPPCPGRGWPQ